AVSQHGIWNWRGPSITPFTRECICEFYNSIPKRFRLGNEVKSSPCASPNRGFGSARTQWLRRYFFYVRDALGYIRYSKTLCRGKIGAYHWKQIFLTFATTQTH
ncbi:unnamed protein product, partial [Ixodes persulcatus]